jgi:WD40 repeat protein
MHRKLWDVTNPGTPFSPIGGTLATGRADSTVKLWDTTTLASRA